MVEELVIRMPKLSESMTEGKVLHWRVKPGDFVGPGEVVGEVETDKANMELEATVAGYVAEILVPVGSMAPVGAPLLRLTNNLDELASLNAVSAIQQEDLPHSSTMGAESLVADSVEVKDRSFDKASPENVSPVARELAKKLDIDLSKVSGSGPGGRITKDDVLRAKEAELQSSVVSAVVSQNTETISLSEIGVLAGDEESRTKTVLSSADVPYPVRLKSVTFTAKVPGGPLLDTIERLIDKMQLRARIQPDALFPLFIGRAFAIAFQGVPAEAAESFSPHAVADCAAFATTVMGRRLYPTLHGVASCPLSKLVTDFLDQRERSLAGSLRCEECLGAQFIVEVLHLPAGAVSAIELDESSSPLVLITATKLNEFQMTLAVRSTLSNLSVWADVHRTACELLEFPLLLAEKFTPSNGQG